MEMKIPAIAITAVVVVIVLAGVLMPVLDDNTSKTKTYENVGLFYSLVDEDDTDTHTIVVTADGVTSDGVTIDGSSLPGDYTLVFGQHSILRYAPSTGRVVFGGTVGVGTSEQFTDVRTANSEQTLTISIVGDSMTTVNGETTKTIEDNWAFVSNEGDYVYCVNPCVTAGDRIIGGGVTYSPFSSATVICFDGTIDEISATIAKSSPSATLNSIDVETSEVVSNLVKIDAIKFNATQSENDVTATYTYFLAPAEVTYDNPSYVGDAGTPILMVIPVMIVLALLVGVVALVFRGRDF